MIFTGDNGTLPAITQEFHIHRVQGGKGQTIDDGRSLAPAFPGTPHVPRDAVYCWYERNGIRNKKASQHTRADRYKLYATGKFFDTQEDPLEKNDLAASGLPEQLAAIHKSLKTALDLRIVVTTKFDPIQSARVKAWKGNGKQ